LCRCRRLCFCGRGFAVLGSVGSGGTGFDLADVPSDRLELVAVCAGAEGSVFVAKDSDFAALGGVGSGGTGFDLADVPSYRLGLLAVCVGAEDSVFVAKGSDIIEKNYSLPHPFV
jgi:hypothetical protein